MVRRSYQKKTQLKFRVSLKRWNAIPQPPASVRAALTLKKQTRKYLVLASKLRLPAPTVTAFKWHTLGSATTSTHTLVASASLWSVLVFSGRLNALGKSDNVHPPRSPWRSNGFVKKTTVSQRPPRPSVCLLLLWFYRLRCSGVVEREDCTYHQPLRDAWLLPTSCIYWGASTQRERERFGLDEQKRVSQDTGGRAGAAGAHARGLSLFLLTS